MRIFGDPDPVLKLPKGLIFKKEMKDIDKLEVQSVVGFEVTGILPGGNSQVASLLLRHASLYYGRPVYEAENGGQFLYWQAQDAPAGSGVADAEMSGPGQIASHEEEGGKTGWFNIPGWWVIAAQVGLRPEDPRCQACCTDLSMTPDEIQNDAVWLVRDNSKDITAAPEGERQRKQPENWNPKLHAPITDGQIIRVSVEGWHGKMPTGEDFAIDFMDVSGNIVLRFAVKLAHTKDGTVSPADCKVVCNSYDSREQKWGTEEIVGAPRIFTETPLPRPVPMIYFERQDSHWDITLVTGESEDRSPICKFNHRGTLSVSSAPDGEQLPKVVASPVAVKVSDNCDGTKIQTILLEDSTKDTWKDAFVENKLMKLKLEFWSHDTKTGLGMLDGEVQAEKKGMMGKLADITGNLFGTSPKAEDGSGSPLAIEDGPVKALSSVFGVGGGSSSSSP